eukprot:gnl/TRDRNA2_/TRDRNA2_98845_c2_seq1.p1 gnl/TRDRNA2_/TRDRNA2_98845_c2~~gnl/TRDRNA2_/TRDRNA2_98845_c2_seq1.p1  ORF type:complete len:395 (-),score=53.46 gnl/TRDRNA2_/TRDRNA2_98845_c2_seq1:107-1240(-)
MDSVDGEQSEHDEVGVDEPFDGERAPTGGRTADISTGRIPGIHRRTVGMCTIYRASTNAESVIFYSRYSSDLSVVVEWLVALTAVKQQFKSCVASTFDSRVRNAMNTVLAEHSVALEEMTFSCKIKVRIKWLWFPTQTIDTPVFRDVEALLPAWRRLRRFSGKWGANVHVLERWRRLRTFPEEWAAFCSTFLEVSSCADSREQQVARLSAFEESSRRSRELYAMAAEEQWQLRCLRYQALRFERESMAAEERRQRRILREQRRALVREHRAFAREDLAGRRWRASGVREDHLVLRISCLLERWQRDEVKRKSAEARKEAARVRQEAAEHRKLEAHARMQARQVEQERNARWKWMNRRDITMDELLTQRSSFSERTRM